MNLFPNSESVFQWKVYSFFSVNLIRKPMFYSLIIMALMFLICLRSFIPHEPLCIFSMLLHFLDFKNISNKVLSNYIKIGEKNFSLGTKAIYLIEFML